MEFWTMIASLLRRPRVVIPALLVALDLGITAYLAFPTTYTSTATLVLSTTRYGGSESQDPTSPVDLTNPMLNFNDSLKTTSAILISSMGTKDVPKQLEMDTQTTKLVVDDGRSNPRLLGLNGPFLYIEAHSTSAKEAYRVVEAAQTLTEKKLSQWQAAMDAPPRTYVSLVDVVPPTQPVGSHARGIKWAIMAFALAFALCLGVARFIVIRRRQRGSGLAATGAVDGTGSDGDDTDDQAEEAPSRKVAAARARAVSLPVRISARSVDDDEDDEDAEDAEDAVAAIPVKMSARSGHR